MWQHHVVHFSFCLNGAFFFFYKATVFFTNTQKNTFCADSDDWLIKLCFCVTYTFSCFYKINSFIIVVCYAKINHLRLLIIRLTNRYTQWVCSLFHMQIYAMSDDFDGIVFWVNSAFKTKILSAKSSDFLMPFQMALNILYRSLTSRRVGTPLFIWFC